MTPNFSLTLREPGCTAADCGRTALRMAEGKEVFYDYHRERTAGKNDRIADLSGAGHKGPVGVACERHFRMHLLNASYVGS